MRKMKQWSNIKRAGIITWHYPHNFGTMLQAVALQTTINNIRKDVIAEIIDYIDYNELDGKGYSNFGTHMLYKPTIYTPSYYRTAREIYIDELNKRYELFEAFKKKYINLSTNFTDIEDLAVNCIYDIYISGGDQIWNNDIRSYESIFQHMLGFTNNPNKFAYGCGMAAFRMEPYALDFHYLPLLRVYKKFMVRESVGATTLKKYFNTDVDVVLDPVLLLNVEEHQPFVHKLKYNTEIPYIFAYIFGLENENMDERLIYILTEYTKRHRCKILLASNRIPINNEYITTLTAIGPSEWLWLVQNADAVITDSFHGTAFSIIYNRPFISIFRDGRKSTLLNLLGLSDRLIGSYEDLFQADLKLHIDFTNANILLEKERKRCKKLLKEAIDMCV